MMREHSTAVPLRDSAADKDARTEASPAPAPRATATELTWLLLLARESGDELWTFDLTSRTLTLSYVNELDVVQTRVIENAPESVIESGWVHADTVDAYRSFFGDVLSGVGRSSASVMLRNPTDLAYTWCTLAYHMRYDDSGTPVCAVGVRRELEGLQESQRWFKSIPVCLRPHLLRASAANLSSRLVESLLWRENEQTRLVKGIPIDRLIEQTASSLFNESESGSYLSLVDPAALARRYREGRRWSIGRYRTVEKGTVHAIRVAINVRRDTLGSLVAYTYVSLCDQRRNWEAGTDVTVMREAETQLYQHDYAQLIAHTTLSDVASGSMGAVTIICTVQLRPVARRNLDDLATAIGVFLDTDCIASRYDERSISAFFPDVESEDAVRRHISAAIDAARESLADASDPGADWLDDVVLVAETVCGPASSLDVAEAAVRARAACESHDPAEGTVVAWPISAGDGNERAGETPDLLSGISSLGDGELGRYAVIASAMLNTCSPLQAINVALRGIGLHHQARRVYVALVTAEDGMLSIPFEWVCPEASSLRARISNSPVSRFPFIGSHLGARRPVYVERPSAAGGSGVRGVEGEAWRFCMIALSHTTSQSLALCIDGPTRHCGSWELASCVGARILHEWKLFSYSSSHSSGTIAGELGGMPGAAELEQVVARAEGGAWSSLGALVVNIPNVGERVASEGFGQVLKTYGSVKTTLEQHFGMMPVFHTSDPEFVALFPNSSYHAFIQRCAQVRMTLVTAHPHGVQIGSAWSDDMNGAWGTIDEARVIATHDTSPSYDEFPQVGNSNPALESSLPEFNPLSRAAALAQRFTVFFQPKIDMRTGELVGAEALARVIGEDGRLSSPVKAVARMEQSGEIGALDYFVFDSMLALMSSWLKRGYAVPPVSSNFSRTTLLSPTSLASVLAIMSRYPTVPAGLVEMEVTETAIDLGTSTIDELVGRYRALGLRVALDDFGSHYSSVSVLANVRFDAVKLDRSLVCGMPGNEVSRSLIRSIAKICDSQNMDCVAEGVESPDQVAALTEEGCLLCQGYYYDKPMPPELFERKYLVA